MKEYVEGSGLIYGLHKVTEDDHEKVKTLGVPFENRSRYRLIANQNRFLSNLSSDIDAKDSVVPFTASRSVERFRRQAEGSDTALSVHRVTTSNPFLSNFFANRILPSSYLFWAVKRLVDYL
jgi:hypothetical protein